MGTDMPWHSMLFERCKCRCLTQAGQQLLGGGVALGLQPARMRQLCSCSASPLLSGGKEAVQHLHTHRDAVHERSA